MKKQKGAQFKILGDLKISKLTLDIVKLQIKSKKINVLGVLKGQFTF